MKSGKSLVELATELQRQQEQKRDYIADTRKIELSTGNDLHVEGVGAFGVTDNTHKQIAQRLNIPQNYYDLMRNQAPALLTNNVNHWLHENPERRMIRTLDGKARAFLSDRYRALDNFDLANAVLPVLQEAQDMKIESCEITERRMYIKALFPRLESEVKVGDTVQSGLVISNSEIGQGALKVEPLLFRLVCLNGMVVNDHAKRHTHLGRAAANTEEAYELFSDKTLAADDNALWLKIQDTVRAFATDAKQFQSVVQRMRDATENKLSDPIKAIEVTAKRFQFSQSESTSALQHLITGGDLSQYGLLNAVTRMAQDVDSYDRSTELERVGGSILELPRSEWQLIAA